MSAPAGWHQQTDGQERFWDGHQWTGQYRPAQTTTPPKKGGLPVKHLIGYGATALVCLGIGGAMGSGSSGTQAVSAAPTVTQTAPGSTVTTTVTPPARATVTKAVTVKVTPQPKAAITEGVWEVGVDIKPGTYKVISPIEEMCYWEISPTGKDDIVDNGTPTGGRPVVRLHNGQTFTNQGCGDWARVR